jgi:hypothetical protein
MVLDRNLQDSDGNEWPSAVNVESLATIANVLDFGFHW